MAIQKLPSALPIDERIPEILRTLEDSPVLVLQAPPGTGKTTRVPPALLQSRFLGHEKQVIVLQPRRLAAKMAALRVAEELGEDVGRRIGYQFRLEQAMSPSTRVLFVTEGILLRKMLGDRELRNVGVVILDEFHERSLHADLALALLRRLQKTTRPDLRIIVMSATLDTAGVQEYLSGEQKSSCPVITTESRIHEVEIEYLEKPPMGPLDSAVRKAVSGVLAGPGGDILVFLPGMAEIRACERALAPLSGELLICPLHGELSKEEQRKAVLPARQRKVVLSTNVAETSLTIEGVDAVIDSGLARKASYSFWSGMPVLSTRPISRASAIQRAGRAGRTGPGRCVRLYTLGDYQGRAPFEVPEIQRADLTQAVLELKVLGIDSLEGFPWYEEPPPAALQAALALLRRLGALEESGSVTAMGQSLAKLPLHPRIGRILLEADRLGVLESGAWLAAILSEGRTQRLDLSELFDRRTRSQPAEFQDRRLAQVRERLLRSLGFREKTSRAARKDDFPKLSVDLLGQALLHGFPDRVAQKKSRKMGQEKGELLFASMSGTARVADPLVLGNSDFFIALEMDEKQRLGQGRGQLQVRTLWPIQPDWLLGLDSPDLTEGEKLSWNEQARRVESAWQFRYGNLVLNESRGTPTDVQAAAELLSEHVTHFNQICEAELLENWLNRIEFLRKNRRPVLDVSLETDEARANFLRGRLLEFAVGKMSIRELQEGDFLSFLHFDLEDSRREQLERLAPERVQLSGGRRVQVHYERDQAPWIASRLQDFFGMKKGPALLGGTYPLPLHLLAPNQRAVQITTDLSGFWERNYPQLRRELGRRYPKHRWPEDPLS